MSEEKKKLKLVHQGWLTKKGGMIKSWRRRWFRLSSDGILGYWKTQEELEAAQGAINIMELKSIKESNNDTGIDGFMVELMVPSRTYYLLADSRDEALSWIRAITSVSKGSLSQKRTTLSSQKSNISEIVGESENGEDTGANIEEIVGILKNSTHAASASYDENEYESPPSMTSLVLTNQRLELPGFHQMNMQVKTFTRWVNHHLDRRGLSIQDITKDFGDGVMLGNLVEILSGKSLTLNTSPFHNVHKMQNINFTCKFMRDEGNNFPAIPVEGIINGNLKSIMDLVWAIIFFYAIDSKTFQGRKGSNALLGWLQSQTSSYGVTINNFSNAFEDGLILCALFDNFYQRLGFQQLAKYKKRENIKLALDTAQTVWGVPKLFDEEDVYSEPDELSIITYLALCFDMCTYS